VIGLGSRLYSRPGNDLTDRFPLIIEALEGLRSLTFRLRCTAERLARPAAQ